MGGQLKEGSAGSPFAPIYLVLSLPGSVSISRRQDDDDGDASVAAAAAVAADGNGGKRELNHIGQEDMIQS